MELSVVIPSYKGPWLGRTIGSLLGSSGLGPGLEVIVVLDGYRPDSLVYDSRVSYVHLKENLGMRSAINSGMARATGRFVMKTDEHCLFAPNFDLAMTENCPSNAVMVPVRYALDPEAWDRMPGPPTIYEKLCIAEEGLRFAGVRWRRRDRERAGYEIDETMAMQGSCYLMARGWWEGVVGPLQTEGYGQFANESQEICFKTWRAGGRVLVNKLTWYAHKHRLFKRTHSIGRRENTPGWQYAIKTWGDYYHKVILPRWEGSGRSL